MKKKQDLFKVGDNVVYPSHGVGKIIKVEKQEDRKTEKYISNVNNKTDKVCGST